MKATWALTVPLTPAAVTLMSPVPWLTTTPAELEPRVIPRLAKCRLMSPLATRLKVTSATIDCPSTVRFTAVPVSSTKLLTPWVVSIARCRPAVSVTPGTVTATWPLRLPAMPPEAPPAPVIVKLPWPWVRARKVLVPLPRLKLTFCAVSVSVLVPPLTVWVKEKSPVRVWFRTLRVTPVPVISRERAGGEVQRDRLAARAQ